MAKKKESEEEKRERLSQLVDNSEKDDIQAMIIDNIPYCPQCGKVLEGNIIYKRLKVVYVKELDKNVNKFVRKCYGCNIGVTYFCDITMTENKRFSYYKDVVEVVDEDQNVVTE